jgi:hypothetical protein
MAMPTAVRAGNIASSMGLTGTPLRIKLMALASRRRLRSHGCEVVMRTLLVLLVWACVAVPSAARADGPPVDLNGKVHGEHVVLRLSQAQQDEVGRWRTLILTPEQRRSLGKRMRRVPEALIIVTPFMDDCTCDLAMFGIWNRPFEVAVPIESHPTDASADEFERKRTTRKEIETGRRKMAGLAPAPYVEMDIEGKLYTHGREISIEEVLRILDSLTPKNWKEESLYIDRPPHRDSATTERIRQTIATLTESCAKKSLRIFPGLPERTSAGPAKR